MADVAASNVAQASPGPDTESTTYQIMAPTWRMIDDILAGAATIRSRKHLYLPKYEGEGEEEYERRLKATPWRPEFADAHRNLASKPFNKPVLLGDGASERMKTLADDIDARGNNLTVFASEAFSKAIAYGMHAILVDFPPMNPGATLADERASGARPYWVHVPAKDLIALYTEIIGGKEVVTHVRIRECAIERDGDFGEKEVIRIRVLEPGLWRLYEMQTQTINGKDETVFVEVGRGPINRGGKTSVPLALFFVGERKGDYLVKPPLADLADMQIELYRALSRKDEILTFAGSPMLKAKGMASPEDGSTVKVGPKTVLFAPPGDGFDTDWDFVQPAAANIKEIREDVASIIQDMRRLGMQPLTDRSGNPTATGQAIEAAKAQSAVHEWANKLKDALEQAFVFTAEWLGDEAPPSVVVNTDFPVAPQEAESLRTLQAARAAGDLSRESYWEELRRRDVLGPQFDPAEEADRLEQEGPPLGMIRDDDEGGDGVPAAA